MPFKKPHYLYSTWQDMKSRCYNPNHKSYHRYGGRGVDVCKRWILPCSTGFNNFVSDMGEKPEKYTLDRIDNDKGYSPKNCRWATRKTQNRNKTNTRKVIIEGKEYMAVEIAEKAGLKTDTIIERAKSNLSMNEMLDNKKRIFKEGLKFGAKASGAKKRALTHCKRGHEFTPENTSITKQGWRRCKACRRINNF
jgi:hypothetical protein